MSKYNRNVINYRDALLFSLYQITIFSLSLMKYKLTNKLMLYNRFNQWLKIAKKVKKNIDNLLFSSDDENDNFGNDFNTKNIMSTNVNDLTS